MEKTVIVTIEPSKRLSELCGFPYFIEKKFTLRELQGILTDADITEMEQGGQILKQIPVAKEKEHG